MTDAITDAGAGQEAAPAPETTTTENNTAASDDQGGGILLQLPDDGGDASAPEAGDGQPADSGEGNGGEEAQVIPEGYFKLPGEDATDEERAAFRAAMGVPETADGYGDAAEMIKGIEGLPEGYEPTPWLKELAHSQDLSQAAYEALVKREAEGVAQYMAETKKAMAAERLERAKELKAKHGEKTLEKMTVGDRAMKDAYKKVDGLEELFARNGLNQEPAFIEFAMLLGEQFGESAFVGGDGGGGEKNPWAKGSFNLTEQGRLMRENPARAKQLKAAAGA